MSDTSQATDATTQERPAEETIQSGATAVTSEPGKVVAPDPAPGDRASDSGNVHDQKGIDAGTVISHPTEECPNTSGATGSSGFPTPADAGQVEALRRRLFDRFVDSVDYYNSQSREAEEEDEWIGLMVRTQADLKSFFERWNDGPIPSVGGAAESILRMCIFPELGFGWSSGPDVLAQKILVPRRGHSGSTLSALATAEEQLTGSADTELRGSLLVRQIEELFGTHNFLRRLRTTLDVNQRLLALISMLMPLAGIASASSDQRHQQLSDLPILALGRLHALYAHVEELRGKLSDALSEVAELHARHEEASEILASTAVAARSSHDRLAAVVEERDSLREENNQLRNDLGMAHERNRKLSRSNAGLRDEARRSQDRVTDAILARLYDFIWEHGRMNGNPDDWYQLLRAAAVDSPHEVPSGISLMLVKNLYDTRAGVPPPSIHGLAAYKPVSPMPAGSARPSRSGAGGNSDDDDESVVSAETPTTTRTETTKGRQVDTANRGQSPSGTAPQSAAHSGPGYKLPRKATQLSHDTVMAQISQWDDSSEDDNRPRGQPARQTRDDDTGSQEENKEGSGDPNGDVDFIPYQKLGLAHRGDVWFVELALDPATLADCIKLPSRFANDPAKSSGWARVAHPFKLGSTRGHSSTVPYYTMKERQFRVVFGIPTQSQKGTTSFFANYQPSMNWMGEVMQRLHAIGIEEYEALMDTQPWLKMWRQRVRHLFLMDPDDLSAAQLAWLRRLFEFQFKYAEAYWLIGHWLAISKEPRPHDKAYDSRFASWYQLHERRGKYIAHFKQEWGKLLAAQPAGFTRLIWSEPAIWHLNSTCSWTPRRPEDHVTMADQVVELDDLEPFRVRWSNAPGRFVEALLPEQLAILESRVDEAGKPFCWAVPSPHHSTDPVLYDTLTPVVSSIGFDRPSSSAGKRAGASKQADAAKRRRP